MSLGYKKFSYLLEPSFRDVQAVTKKSLRKLKNLSLKLKKVSDLNKKIYIGKKCCKYATKAGILYSKEIEEEFVKVGMSIPFTNHSEFTANSNLHILTKCYDTGGHTRVCERWIEFSVKNETHSLMLVEQESESVPSTLKEAVESRGGKIYNLGSDVVSKINNIRIIGSKYERIILHIHADDIITFVALATNDFKRPVLFYNHLDHVFWLGTAISDMVVNLRSSSTDKSSRLRFVKKNGYLPIPVKIHDRDNDYKKLSYLPCLIA